MYRRRDEEGREKGKQRKTEKLKVFPLRVINPHAFLQFSSPFLSFSHSKHIAQMVIEFRRQFSPPSSNTYTNTLSALLHFFFPFFLQTLSALLPIYAKRFTQKKRFFSTFSSHFLQVSGFGFKRIRGGSGVSVTFKLFAHLGSF